MIKILTVILCFHGRLCMEVNVPTPVTYQCGHARLDTLDAYLRVNYPHWEYKTFACTLGRAV